MIEVKCLRGQISSDFPVFDSLLVYLFEDDLFESVDVDSSVRSGKKV